MNDTYNITINIDKVNINMGFFKRLFRRIKDRCPCPGGGSGSGTGCPKYRGIKLVRRYEESIGVGFHRSGWPYVFSFLESIQSPNGILFDDFVEQNFCYRDKPIVYREPWVGVFHHPPTIPYFGNQRENLLEMFKKPEFKESAKNLKLAFALSEHLAKFLRLHLTCPVVVVKHPIGPSSKVWTQNNYIRNKNKQLVQVGYYLRNTQLINQIPLSSFKKTRLWTKKEWAQIFDDRVKAYWEIQDTRKNYGWNTELTFIPPSAYDEILSKNIVVMEVFDASASNGVLDCIVRNTPIIINKNPAVVEYLGEDYPLYFSHPDEIPLLADKALEAHEYLKNMDKSFLSAELFIKQILSHIEKL